MKVPALFSGKHEKELWYAPVRSYRITWATKFIPFHNYNLLYGKGSHGQRIQG
jgi:hypothetical protein